MSTVYRQSSDVREDFGKVVTTVLKKVVFSWNRVKDDGWDFPSRELGPWVRSLRREGKTSVRERVIWRNWWLLCFHVFHGQINKIWLWNISFNGTDGEYKHTEENRSQNPTLTGVGSKPDLQRVDWSATNLLNHDTVRNPSIKPVWKHSTLWKLEQTFTFWRKVRPFG
jgi:hypothetical protein